MSDTFKAVERSGIFAEKNAHAPYRLRSPIFASIALSLRLKGPPRFFQYSLAVLSLIALASTCLGGHLSMDPASRLSVDEKQAWKLFSAATQALQDKGDRSEAARLFGRVAKEFPRSRYFDESKELASLLRPMIDEDKGWSEPSDPEALPLQKKVTCY